MRRELWALALITVFSACDGPDTPDDSGLDDTSEPQDTGDTADSDSDTDTDTDTGVIDTCGDGVLDAGEECDLGTDNADDGSCSTDCEWVGFVTCDALDGTVQLDASTEQSDGSFQISGRFDGTPLGLLSTCTTDPLDQVAVVVHIPADGDYLLSTENPNTTANTSLDLREECDDRTAITCAVGNGSASGSSRVLLQDALEGDTFTVLVEHVDGPIGNWHLSMVAATSLVAEDEACGDDVLCQDGFTCSDPGDGAVCVGVAAPTIDSITAESVSSSLYLHTVTGVDPNHDVTGIQVTYAETTDANIWGDSPSETPLPIYVYDIVWSGDTYTITWTDYARVSTLPSTVSKIKVQTLDSSGLLSNEQELTYEAAPSTTYNLLEGEACDLGGWPRKCKSSLVCTLQSSGDSECTVDGSAPVLEGISMEWDQGIPYLLIDGYDASWDIFDVNFQLNLNGAEPVVDIGRNFKSSYPEVREHRLDGDFYGRMSMEPYVDYDIDTVEISLTDRTDYTSETLTMDWVDYVAPSVVGAGETCDPKGNLTACDTGLACGPSYAGDFVCATAEAPQIYSVGPVVFTARAGQSTAQTYLEAYDANADIESITGHSFVWNEQFQAFQRSRSTLPKTTFTPSPDARLFDGYAILRNAQGPMLAVELADAAGLQSELVRIPTGDDVLELGDSCTPGDTLFACDAEQDLVCGFASSVCEATEAPTLSTFTVRRLNSTNYRIEADGTDSNGNVVDLRVFETVDGETEVNYESLETTVAKQTSFTAVADVRITDPASVITLEGSLGDSFATFSNTLTGTVPPIVEAGGACSGDNTIDACWEGTACINSVCTVAPPELNGAQLFWDGSGRNAVLEITGTDASEDVQSYTVDFGDLSFGGPAKNTSASKGPNSTISWSTGGAFTIQAELPGLGTGTLIGVTSMTVTATDLLDETSTFNAAVKPSVELGGSCDTTGTNDTCLPGASCDAGTCVTDTSDVCGGISIVDGNATGSGDTTAFTVPFDHTVSPDIHRNTCGSSTTQADGGEGVISWTAPQAGTVNISSESTYVYLFVYKNECVADDALDACATAYKSKVDVDVETGDVLYVVTDTRSSNGTLTGSLVFSYK